MSFLSASGPKSQLVAWVGVSAAGLAFYIYTKGQTEEKKRIDMELKRSGQFPGNIDADGLPTRRRGGVGVSSASAHYRSPSATPSAEANFMPRSFLDSPSFVPMTLAEYRRSLQSASINNTRPDQR